MTRRPNSRTSGRRTSRTTRQPTMPPGVPAGCDRQHDKRHCSRCDQDSNPRRLARAGVGQKPIERRRTCTKRSQQSGTSSRLERQPATRGGSPRQRWTTLLRRLAGHRGHQGLRAIAQHRPGGGSHGVVGTQRSDERSAAVHRWSRGAGAAPGADRHRRAWCGSGRCRRRIKPMPARQRSRTALRASQADKTLTFEAGKTNQPRVCRSRLYNKAFLSEAPDRSATGQHAQQPARRQQRDAERQRMTCSTTCMLLSERRLGLMAT